MYEPQPPAAPSRSLTGRRRRILALALAVLFVLFVALGFDQRLQVTRYRYYNSKLPQAFEGTRIAFLSDLHCKSFGRGQSELLAAIEEAKPDIVVLTGDIVDESHTDLSAVEALLQGLQAIAPAYYITGNHELLPTAANQYDSLLKLLEQYGVTNLDDRTVALKKDDQSIALTGSRYRSFYVTQYLPQADESQFNILLYHGSDVFDLLAPFGYDLVLAGHTHGGLVRLPLVGGLIGNDGELFPPYDGGIYTQGASTMLSSRGLGDAVLPRFYNRPELVLVTLTQEK